MKRKLFGLLILPLVSLFGLTSCRYYTIDPGINPKLKPVAVSATANKEFYVDDDISIYDFTVKVTFSDVSIKTVNNAYFDHDVDTSSAGDVDVSISYTFNQVTVSTVTTITINEKDPVDVIPTSISVGQLESIYVDDEITIDKFTVFVYFSDDTYRRVYDAYIDSEYLDTSYPHDLDVTIAYYSNGVTVFTTITVEVLENVIVVPTSIEVAPTKDFYVNETITISDFSVRVYFSDGNDKYVTNAVLVNPVDTSTAGTKEVTISYTANEETVSVTFDITVQTPSVYPVSISSVMPERDFVVGDKLTINDFIVWVTYSDESNLQVSDAYIIGSIDTSTSGYKVVAFGYDQYGVHVEGVFEFYVKSFEELTPVSMDVIVNETFDVGDYLYISDLVVTVTFMGNIVKIVDDAYFYNHEESVLLSNIGVNYVTVYYSNNNVEISAVSEVYAYDSSATIYSYTLSYSSVNWPTGSNYYSTGNQFETDGFGYYRAVKGDNTYIRLFPCPNQYMTGMSGSIYSLSVYRDIYSFSLTYYNSGSSSASPRIYYGENNYFDNSISVPYSSSLTTKEFILDSHDANYFQISSGSSTMNIESLTINYYDAPTPHGSSFIYSDANLGQNRITPTVYSGSLVDGVSYVDVPTSIDFNTQTILSTKRYTYYSYEYVSSNPSYKAQAAMTNPVDVCNYFIAFGSAPANYGAKSSFSPLRDGKEIPTKSQVDSLFGSDARIISKYSGTYGYASAVPYYGTPTYYELDIGLDSSYSTSSRQVGRVIGWATGFSGSDYDYGSQVVCTFTDDHYSTFREYNNYGGFMPAFNAEKSIAGARWSNPTTYDSSSFNHGSSILDGAIKLDYSKCDYFNYIILVNGMPEFNLYLLSSGDSLYIEEYAISLNVVHIHDDLYIIPQSLNSSYGNYVLIDTVKGTISDPGLQSEYVTHSGSYFESTLVSSWTLESAFEYAVNKMYELGYSICYDYNGGEPESFTDEDSGVSYMQLGLISSDEKFFCFAVAMTNGVQYFAQIELYMYDPNGIVQGPTSPMPTDLDDESNDICDKFDFSYTAIDTSYYENYGCVLVGELLEESSTGQETLVATFSIGPEYLEMVYYYTYNNESYYAVFDLGYSFEPGDNAYYVLSPTGTNYKLSVISATEVLVEVVSN